MAQQGTITGIPSPQGPFEVAWKYAVSGSLTSDFIWPATGIGATTGFASTLPVRFDGAHGVLGGNLTLYLMFFDSATVPANGTTPDGGIVLIPAPATWSLNVLSRPMLKGISWALSTTQLTLTLAAAQSINVLATWRQV